MTSAEDSTYGSVVGCTCSDNAESIHDSITQQNEVRSAMPIVQQPTPSVQTPFTQQPTPFTQQPPDPVKRPPPVNDEDNDDEFWKRVGCVPRSSRVEEG